MTRKFLFLLACGLVVVATSSAQAEIVVWDDPDPAGASDLNVGVVVNSIPDPTGDASRTTVGEVDLGGAGRWSSLDAGDFAPLPASLLGNSATITFDYYIPADSTFDDFNTAGANPSLFYQISTPENGNVRNGGFFNPVDAVRDTWQQFSVTTTIPELVAFDDDNDANTPPIDVAPTGVLPLVVIQRGIDPNLPSGTAFYIDNIKFTIVPEPATFGLMGIGLAAMTLRRRRGE